MPFRPVRRIRRLLGRAPDRSRRTRGGHGPAGGPPRGRHFEQLPAVPECPPGWRTGPPDFIIFGAQKSGTTWWFWLIADHPGVVQPADQRPELHFFDRLWDRWPDDELIVAYHRYFPRPHGSLVGEKTPEYLSCVWAPPMMARAAPEARAIVLLRDPVERFVSGVSHFERGGLLSEDAADGRLFGDRLRVVTDAVERGNYARQLEWLMEAFPAERLLVLQYERCVTDTRAQLARTYAFLGLPPHEPAAEDLARLRNASRREKVRVPSEHLELLRRYYRPDVRHLADLVPDLDLDAWPNYRDLAVRR
jgi:hypothetical protein